MATSLPNALVFENPYCKTTYLSKQGPGKWTVTVEKKKEMGDDVTWECHLYHQLRDWIHPHQINLIDKDCDSRKAFMFSIDLGIENGKEGS